MRLLSALLWFTLLIWAAPAVAQNPIQHCVGANGSPVFTDQPCTALQATSVDPAAKPSESSHPLEPPPTTLCAATIDALRQSVIDAFANHDANRLAGLMLWNGYGHGAAVADIRSLSALMQRPLLDLSPSRDSPPAADSSSADPYAPTTPPASPPASDQLVLHTAGTDGSGSPHELRFGIVRHAGCLWLRNTD
ncbi:DUF4124 domain-containing protein [Rhodanobacter sp. MP7CTX1]|uniref:DUF4124 domain-containing protein n=1 Tax=Rhodanobacter sp. MP7CTX1 TaxID=2723084 RepID=UPI00161BADE1|nr:DUF4124 domain-containing protein [Rhodanobacter sp. MP7CTX1]MBB6186519.1 hypothetical protein [Rhodanobacter sp. MP7CTX1]